MKHTTRYEVVLVGSCTCHDSLIPVECVTELLVGYTAKRSRPGLDALLRLHRDNIWALIGTSSRPIPVYRPDEKTYTLGRNWRVQFSGRTEHRARGRRSGWPVDRILSAYGCGTAREELHAALAAGEPRTCWCGREIPRAAD